MIAPISGIRLTLAVRGWLRACSDDRNRPLRVRAVLGGVEVVHADGSELSTTERAHVRGVLAANAAEPLRGWPRSI